MQRVFTCVVLATLAVIYCGCGATNGVKNQIKVDTTQRPLAKDATKEELLEKYNNIAQNVKSLTSTVQLKPTAGSKYSGVIDEYHEVKAFLLAERPEKIRVIGQAPVIGTTVFDMASDGTTFHVSIPSKNKFLVGPVAVERTSNKPIENLRPQHLVDALLWNQVRKQEAVLFEEFNDEIGRYYVLTVLRGGYQTEILRKIWFDRSNLQISRLQTFGPKGVLLSDVHVSDWQPLDSTSPTGTPATAASPNTPATSSAVTSFPRAIRIERPHDDYRLDLLIQKVTLNEEIPAARFKLEQPPGAELIRVSDDSEEKKPVKDSSKP